MNDVISDVLGGRVTARMALRIEALRTASRLVAGALAADIPLYESGKKTDPVTATMNAADQLVCWIQKSDE